MLFRFDPLDLHTGDTGRQRPSLLAMDATRRDDEVIVYFDAPGVHPDDLDVTVEKNTVTVQASRRWVDTDVRTLTSERPQGIFKRQIELSDSLETSEIEAELEHGVITLTIPIKEGTKPRSIEVRSGTSAPKELETSS